MFDSSSTLSEHHSLLHHLYNLYIIYHKKIIFHSTISLLDMMRWTISYSFPHFDDLARHLTYTRLVINYFNWYITVILAMLIGTSLIRHKWGTKSNGCCICLRLPLASNKLIFFLRIIDLEISFQIQLL